MKIKTKTFVGDNEEKIIKDFHKFISTRKNVILSGFNSQSFDDKIMLSRFIKYRLGKAELFGRYDTIDTRLLLGGTTDKGTLQDYLSLFNMEGKYNGYNGASVQKLWEEGKWKEIEKYVGQDSIIEHRLLLETAKFIKIKHNLSNIITYDIEVVAPKESLPNKVDLFAQKEAEIRKKYKQASTINKHVSEINIEKEYEKNCKEIIFNKFKNKVVAIGCSWLEDEEEF